MVALYPLSSPNHNPLGSLVILGVLRYILFHHQTTTAASFLQIDDALRYILFHHQTTTILCNLLLRVLLRYILFHHQTTTYGLYFRDVGSCVISSFITKPQPGIRHRPGHTSCVISSFITKPQPDFLDITTFSCCVISSFITKPQLSTKPLPPSTVALYPLSSPNHNSIVCRLTLTVLRYILFHHQTTTVVRYEIRDNRCVISSFITKPQLDWFCEYGHECCVISSFITKPQLLSFISVEVSVALYPLSSPNHNLCVVQIRLKELRYILFHHQTTTKLS